MSVFTNPSFYVSIFSSICFICSEILPFLPTDCNGLTHSIILMLSQYNKSVIIDNATLHKDKEIMLKEQMKDQLPDIKINNI
jgi:hypothetical protein